MKTDDVRISEFAELYFELISGSRLSADEYTRQTGMNVRSFYRYMEFISLQLALVRDLEGRFCLMNRAHWVPNIDDDEIEDESEREPKPDSYMARYAQFLAKKESELGKNTKKSSSR